MNRWWLWRFTAKTSQRTNLAPHNPRCLSKSLLVAAITCSEQTGSKLHETRRYWHLSILKVRKVFDEYLIMLVDIVGIWGRFPRFCDAPLHSLTKARSGPRFASLEISAFMANTLDWLALIHVMDHYIFNLAFVWRLTTIFTPTPWAVSKPCLSSLSFWVQVQSIIDRDIVPLQKELHCPARNHEWQSHVYRSSSHTNASKRWNQDPNNPWL